MEGEDIIHVSWDSSDGATTVVGGSSSLVRRTIVDYAVYLPALVVPGILNVVFVPVLTRLFDPREYGRYVLATGVWNILPTLATLWIDSAVVRLVPQHIRQGTLPSFALLVGVVEAIIIILLTISGVWILSSWSHSLDADLIFLYRIAIIGFPGFALLLTTQSFLRAQGLAVDYTILTVSRAIVGMMVGLFVASRLRYGIAGFMAGMIAVVAVLALLGLIRCIWILKSNYDEGFAKCGWNWAWLTDTAKYGIPVAGLNIAAQVLSIADRYIIAVFHGSEAAGIYNAGYVIPENTMRLLSLSILAAATPITFWIQEIQGDQSASGYVGKLVWGYSFVGLPVLIGFNLLRQELFQAIVGPAFLQSAALVPFVSVALFLHGYTMILNLEFFARKRSTIPLLLMTVSAGINILANFLLVPALDSLGAAWATLIAYSGLMMLTAVFLWKQISWPIVTVELVRIGVGAIAMIALLGLLGQVLALPTWLRIVILGATGAVVYIVAALLMGGMPRRLMLRWLRVIREASVL